MTNPTVSIQEIRNRITSDAGVHLSLLREDQNHVSIQGNKYWKLFYNIKEAIAQQASCVITFGGAFSNHIHATAAATKASGIPSIGIIRGERPEPLNPTLNFAEQQGMQLEFVSRNTYRNKHEPEYIQSLRDTYPGCYIIPEGGTNPLAIKGCKEWAKKRVPTNDYDIICIPVGTGGSITGWILTHPHIRIIGYSSLKGNFLQKDVANLIQQNQSKNTDYHQWEINNEYHFGGYARHKPKLIQFINDFKRTSDIQLDPIYTGKMMYGIMNQIQNNHFPKGSRILAIHTGGLQGLEGFNQRFNGILNS